MLDNTHPVVGVDDLIADVKIQVRTTHKRYPGRVRVLVGKSVVLLAPDYAEMG